MNLGRKRVCATCRTEPWLTNGSFIAKSILKVREQRPNNSFKPTPLRYAKHMAGTACHVLHSTTQRGLTQALGAKAKKRSSE